VVILWLVEAGKWTKEDARVLAHVTKAQVPVILCVNKIDKLKDKQAVLPFLADIGKKYQPKYFRINARSALVSGLLNAESGNKSSG
jgi:GTPase Era involved in 16S rRNA processing